MPPVFRAAMMRHAVYAAAALFAAACFPLPFAAAILMFAAPAIDITCATIFAIFIFFRFSPFDAALFSLLPFTRLFTLPPRDAASRRAPPADAFSQASADHAWRAMLRV